MIYFAPCKSKASYVEYDRMIAEWLANNYLVYMIITRKGLE